MGCAQSNSSTNSSPNRLHKLKMENGYVPKGALAGHRRSNAQNYLGSRKNNSDPPPRKLSDQIGVGKKDSPLEIDAVEVVNGWPKWLTDNVPAEVLANLVPKSAENYDKIDKAGQGTYSNVYKARDRDTGKIVALKKVKFDTSQPESVKFMAREITILQELDHPNVLKLEGLATSRMQYSLYLVFDFMQSDLSSIINNPEARLTEPQVKCYMQQLLSGLQHCHERGILHRDIKGSNLLIDKKGMLKIADFGLANYYNPKRPLTSRVVTLWYRAPELLLGSTNYGVGIDLWSAGCLLAEMLAARPIMPGRTEVEQLHRIFKLCGTPSEDYWKKLKLSTTFRPPKQYKPSLFEAFGEFPESSLGLLTTLLALDPAYRGSASSALQSEFFYISPLPCDLSGLPVILREEDEIAQANQLRIHRNNSKMKRRSRTYREQRSKDVLAEKPIADSTNSEKEAENVEKPKSQESAGGSSSGSSSSARAELSPVPTWKQKMSPKTQGLPPLPGYNKSSSSNKYSNQSLYNLNKMHRSASTREFRKLNQTQHLQLYAIEN
ncbi:probable serine/threonine-protein kinase At1g54610 [Euphorbia lathyris]|uniref:probable serine/threonine-protein kinase At1g54610 n=1 Tax=Euphorbia lathyris TaxID=212925 RepID=UPI003313E350